MWLRPLAEKPHTVRGKVLDNESKPLVGVGVIVVNTLQGVVTDANGNYEIKATPSQELQFSYLGYKTESAQYGRRDNKKGYQAGLGDEQMKWSEGLIMRI